MFPGLLLPLALVSAISTESDVRSVDCSSPFADRVLCQMLEEEAMHEIALQAKFRKG